jgi:hypothetical protein
VLYAMGCDFARRLVLGTSFFFFLKTWPKLRSGCYPLVNIRAANEFDQLG